MSIPNFNETVYLAKYPDVAEAVSKKVIPDGQTHYLKYGIKEKRTDVIDPVTSQSRVWIAYKNFAVYHPSLEDVTFFENLMNKIRKKENFHLARYNDGEWVFMLQIQPHFEACLKENNHQREDVLKISDKLLKILDSSPNYYIGIDSTTRAGKGLVSNSAIKVKKKIDCIKNIVYGDIFNAATIRLGIDKLLDPLKTRHVISIGPSYMKLLNISQCHISVPLNNCWRDYQQIESAINSEIISNLNKSPVVIYSCSLLAKLLVDIFYHKFGDKISQLDLGSCIDPWCGINSRPWHLELAKHYVLKIKTDP